MMPATAGETSNPPAGTIRSVQPGSAGTQDQAAGWKIKMTRILLLALGLLFAASIGHAQTAPPLQSLKPTPSACTLGSQSLRVCNNDLQSCNDVCSARALDVNADIAGCTTACCYQYNVCLRMRNCGSRIINCN
jgi:hypothetical protein